MVAKALSLLDFIHRETISEHGLGGPAPGARLMQGAVPGHESLNFVESLGHGLSALSAFSPRDFAPGQQLQPLTDTGFSLPAPEFGQATAGQPPEFGQAYSFGQPPSGLGPPAAASFANVSTMATYLVSGFWAYSGYDGTGTRHWASNTVTVNLTGLTAQEQVLARGALAVWSTVANLNFVETSSASANIMYNHNGGAASYVANTSDTVAISGGHYQQETIDISAYWFAQDGGAQDGRTGYNSYDFQTYIHETGHALGLGHQGPYNGSATYGVDNIYTDDTWQYSVMSYMSQNNYNGGSYDYVIGPQMIDIAAIQSIYGAPTASVTAGDTVWGYNHVGFSPVSTIWSLSAYTGQNIPSFTIYDSGGNDTLDASGYGGAQTIDLRSGDAANDMHWSSIGGYTHNIAIYITSTIENAIGGSGNDIFYGNAVNNVIAGNGGVDTVVFAGNLNDFSFAEGDNHSYTVTGAGQGTDTLNGIATFSFNDATVTDDVVGGVSTSRTLSAGAASTGTAQFNGDQDWFGVTLQAGHTYVINERGAPSGVGTLTDEYLRLYSGTGALLAQNDDGGLGYESQIAVHASGAATSFFASAGSFDTNYGTYSLSIDDLGATRATRFQVMSNDLSAFGVIAGGWSTNDQFPRMLGQANSDPHEPGIGLADIFGFGHGGVYVADSNGHGFNTAAFVLGAFGSDPSAGSWTSQDQFPRMVGNVDAQNFDDIVGFGHGGVYVALSNGANSWANPAYAFGYFGADPSAGGWASQNTYPRALADVDGDGRADIVGFGNAGVYVALNNGAGSWGAPSLVLNAFGYLGAAGGWTSSDQYPRYLADVNGDGKADIVGFGNGGVYVALATTGGHFDTPSFTLGAFGQNASAGGWTSLDQFPRELGDVNGDGRADIVGYGYGGVYVALANADGTFAAPTTDLGQFGYLGVAGGWTGFNEFPRLLGDITGDGRADIVAFGYGGVFDSHSFDLVNV